LAVVAAEFTSIALVAVAVLVELGCLLDLILRAVDKHRFRIEIDVRKETGREKDLLPEDPRAGIDDDVTAADPLRR
jgi:hypothetical protein